MQHTLHNGSADTDAKNHCDCGCNCSGMFCATGCSGIMAGNGLQDLRHINSQYQRAAAGWNHPVVAHSLRLLRPPSPV